MGETLHHSEFVFPSLWGGQGSCRVEGDGHIWAFGAVKCLPVAVTGTVHYLSYHQDETPVINDSSEEQSIWA